MGAFNDYRDQAEAALVLGYLRPGWVPPAAKFVADFENNLFFWNNSVYPNENAFLTAIGGSKSGNAIIIGSYLDPNNTNLLTNGDFTNNVTGWTATSQTSGQVLAWASGEAQLTGGGANIPQFNQGITGSLGKAFRVQGTGRRGTTTNNLEFLVTANQAPGGPTDRPAPTAIFSTNATVLTGYAAGLAATTYIGFRVPSNGSAGTSLYDNISAIEAWPFNGFTQPIESAGWSVAIDAKTAVAASVDEVLFQTDVPVYNIAYVLGNYNRVAIYRRVSDDHLIVDVRISATATVNMDLGVVADATDFSVSLSVAQNNVSASLNGGLPITDTSAAVPGAAFMRVGESITGDTWTGEIHKVTLF